MFDSQESALKTLANGFADVAERTLLTHIEGTLNQYKKKKLKLVLSNA